MVDESYVVREFHGSDENGVKGIDWVTSVENPLSTI